MVNVGTMVARSRRWWRCWQEEEQIHVVCRRYNIRVKGVVFLEMEWRDISFDGQGRRRKRELV